MGSRRSHGHSLLYWRLRVRLQRKNLRHGPDSISVRQLSEHILVRLVTYHPPLNSNRHDDLLSSPHLQKIQQVRRENIEQ